MRDTIDQRLAPLEIAATKLRKSDLDVIGDRIRLPADVRTAGRWPERVRDTCVQSAHQRRWRRRRPRLPRFQRQLAFEVVDELRAVVHHEAVGDRRRSAPSATVSSRNCRCCCSSRRRGGTRRRRRRPASVRYTRRLFTSRPGSFVGGVGPMGSVTRTRPRVPGVVTVIGGEGGLALVSLPLAST